MTASDVMQNRHELILIHSASVGGGDLHFYGTVQSRSGIMPRLSILLAEDKRREEKIRQLFLNPKLEIIVKKTTAF